MNAINEFNLEPGTYRHYKGGLYVVLDIITHMDGPGGKMEGLADPLVCYRDINAIVRHVNGKPMSAHQRYARPLSEFIGNAKREDGTEIKRFTKL